MNIKDFGRLQSRYADLVNDLDHRPYPLSSSPWIMRQTWANLLFAHWELPIERARELVPDCLELDLYDGRAYVGVVPFEMHQVAPRMVPAVRGLSFFPELNVRLYVKHGDRPGVYFLSLDAANPIAVWIAITLYHLPYHYAEMRSTTIDNDDGQDKTDIAYFSRRVTRPTSRGIHSPACQFEARYGPVGEVFASERGSLEYFLTERYCLYTTWANRLYRGEIQHKPWPLQKAHATFATNTMLDVHGIKPVHTEPHLLFARSIDTIEWAIEPI